MNTAPLASTTAPVFTVARIAADLGRFPQAVRKSIHGAQPSGAALAKGAECAAWSLADLPKPLRDELEATARRRRFRDATAMLSAPAAAPWQPPCPLSEMAEAEIERANKLRRALMPSLLNQHVDALSAAEFEARGVDQYARVFGHAISTRHWRSLFKRTIERDAGAENFGRIELYVSDKPARKSTGPQIVCEALEEISGDFSALHDYISACGNPAAPNEEEQRGLWTRAFDLYDRLVNRGESPKRAARQLRNFLSRKAAFLAPSRHALFLAFARKLESWLEGERKPDALRDRRKDNGAHFEIPQPDLDEVEKRIVFTYGDYAPAWRSAYDDGKLSDAIAKRWPAEKHRVGWYPPLFKKYLGQRAYWLYTYHRRRRDFNSEKAHADSIYDGIYSLDCISADDVTLPIWHWHLPPGSDKPIVTRGQCLIFIDLVSKRIIGFSLQPDKNYNAIVIYSQMKRICVEEAMPKAWLFEHGIWEKAKLIAGTTGRPSAAEVVHSFRKLGTDFFYADTPEGKCEIENVMGLVQNLMEGERGYCGRDERRDRPDWIKKQLAEIASTTSCTHPSAYFYEFEELNSRLSDIFAKYNSLPQSGKHMRGRSPNDVYIQNWNRLAPPEKGGAEVSHIFDPKFEKIVKPSGVSIRSGKREFKYFGPEIAHLVGHPVFLRFDTEYPETAVVTTKDDQNPIAVPLHNGVPRLERLTNPNSEILAEFCSRREGQVKGIIARYNILKGDFELPYGKRKTPQHVVDLERQIEISKGVLEGKTEVHRRNLQYANRLITETGIVQPAKAIGRDPEAGKEVRVFLNRKTKSAEKPTAPGKTYILKSATPKTPEGEYVDYLLNRLTECRKAGEKYFGQAFGGAVTFHSVARIARAHLKCDLYAPEHFETVCVYLQEKIDATALAKSKGTPMYHPFEKAAL